ncbi:MULTISPECIES: LacI family DNA-binding transcriptional regulator [unclassified Paenibacillus]|uniref:LacI family DNA-binding transcriptional regulator n=1 Tax=unclassified Paenibacillus TaxID=185978 RepID=UPI001C1186AF|nr:MULTISPECIES: LacI family DNA-binding transcriptional regulator [unclassified Paenibacillus]MBU5444426.1 LacI family transcriptional regulator [Paenibacillus sp. MSJ-34]CAH0120146.1 HTH-type transcriptional repressor CytR [Paenibacillus sp. CECT 9249]
MATLKDIAERVGVSISTVSRVINNDNSKVVSAATRDKIWKAVEELGYKPNVWARKLVKGEDLPPSSGKKAGAILSVPQGNFSNPYFSLVVKGIQQGLAERGYELSYLHTIDELQNPAVKQKVMKDIRVDGLIIVEGIDSKLYEYFKKNVNVIVGVDLNDPTIPTVSYDRISAAKTAVDHLISQGHCKIGFIGGLGLSKNIRREKRFRGYYYALMEAGLELNEAWIIDAHWQIENSYESMKRLLEQGGPIPTAFFVASDVMAIAAMRAASEHGLRIPQDMAFVGVDNIDLSQYTSPPLSTIHVPKYEIGLTAARLLADYLEERSNIPVKVLLPYELKIRQSSTNFDGND